jgi:hypothetical protein
MVLVMVIIGGPDGSAATLTPPVASMAEPAELAVMVLLSMTSGPLSRRKAAPPAAKAIELAALLPERVLLRMVAVPPVPPEASPRAIPPPVPVVAALPETVLPKTVSVPSPPTPPPSRDAVLPAAVLS